MYLSGERIRKINAIYLLHDAGKNLKTNPRDDNDGVIENEARSPINSCISVGRVTSIALSK